MSRVNSPLAAQPKSRWLALFALPMLSLCDLPVHCERHQVVGDWEFTLSGLSNTRSSCGHKHPDDQNAQPPLSFVSSQGATTTMRISLQDPATAVSADKSQTGTWTMIYDEGFEVKLGDQVFVAFSHFSWVTDPETSKKSNVSHCDATQVGWYHDTARTQFGCYTGRKVGAPVPAPSAPPPKKPVTALVVQPAEETLAPEAAAQEDQPEDDSSALEASDASEAQTPPQQQQAGMLPVSEDAADDVDTEGAAAPGAPPAVDTAETLALAAAKVSQVAGSEAQAQATDGSASSATVAAPADDSAAAAPQDPPQQATELYTPWVPSSAGYDHPMAGEWQKGVADALNFLELGWTAFAYGKFRGKTPRELNRFAGVRHKRVRPQAHGGAPDVAAVSADEAPVSSFLGISSKVRGTGAKAKGHRAHHLHAEHLDWRRKDGHNWLTHVVEQGDCGSCYTISTVHMLTARHRIAKRDPTATSFSVSFPLYCSEFNQGCDGGYGFLQSKWSEDVGLVPESCMAFSQGGGSCHAMPKCNLGGTRFRAVNHHYVGGYYGGSDAASIKQELVERGPVVMSFEPKEDFMYYKSGVYKSGARKIHQEWEQVDHAVLLVGFGADRGQDYWTLQNSWGTDWGEHGYFRMARGIDESGCESIVVAAEVVEEQSNEVLDQFLAALQ